MKKNTLKQLLPLLLVSTLSLQAEVSFNLRSQNFSEAIAGNHTGARYDLPKAYASTNLADLNGTYVTQNNSGYFGVEVKNPQPNGSVSIDISYYLNHSSRSVKIASDNGQSLTVSYRSQHIQFDGKDIQKSDLTSTERITTEFIQDGDNIDVFVNGLKIGTANRPNFGNIQFVDAQLSIDEYASTYFYDTLNSLTVGSR